MRRRVALIVDHPERDLAGIVLLAHELSHRGISCHLVPLNRQERELWTLAPDFVLLNYTRRGTEALAQRLLDAGIDFGLLDTEGVIWTGEIGPDGSIRAGFEKYTELLWRDPSLLKRASVVCTWGPRLAEHLASGGWFARKQLIPTGCPRFDFYHPRWRPVCDTRPGHESERPRQILINTLSPTVNSRLVPVSVNEMELRDVLGWPVERIRQYLDAERGAIRGLIEVARRLAHDYPTLEILLRPHPFEDEGVYRSALGNLKNVRVDGSGPVYSRIFESAVLIARGCTTAVEAAMAGVPSLSPQWIPGPYVNPISEATSVSCGDYESLKSYIDEIFAGRYQPSPDLNRAVETVLGDWFHGSDGLAHRRVADAIVSRLAGPRRVNEELCARFLRAHEKVLRSRRGLGHAVRRILRLPPDWCFRRMRVVPSPGKTVKYFGASDVERLVKRLALVSGKTGGLAAEPTVRLVGGIPPGQEKEMRSVTLDPGSAGAGRKPISGKALV
jgi:surface carbohydrate biosynthesis protein